MKKIINKNFKVKLITNPLQKCLDSTGFSVKIEKVSDTAAPRNVSFTASNFAELVDVVSDYAVAPVITVDAVIGASGVTVNDGTLCTVGESVRVKNYTYNIVSIVDNSIIFNKPLKENILASENIALSRKGNNGEYEFTLSITDKGYFKLTIMNNDKDIYTEVADIIEIVDFILSNDSASVVA